MKTIIRIPDVPVSALDVFRMLPEGTRAEVINNVLYMSPSPIFNHQKLVSTLFLKLGNHIEEKALGELIVSPFDVYLDEYISAVQPDLLFIARRNKGILKEDGYAHGAPDLIIEILSNNETRDRTLKKSLYEKAGVKEYFIVDPKTKMTEAFVLKGKKYQVNYSRKKYFQSALLKLEFTF
ncbi:MAG: Uma2 family endonuclease [Chitinophagaceae bacterium]|nr:Uma2 family endonuclease [Chitinophagaceae bacterium]